MIRSFSSVSSSPRFFTSPSVISPNLIRVKPLASNTLATSDFPEPAIPTIETTLIIHLYELHYRQNSRQMAISIA